MRTIRVIFTAAVVATCTSIGVISALPASAASTVHYVALGDSYSSGVGAGSYISSSGSCDRSTNAYPEKWASAHSPATFNSVACSAARTSDVLSGQLSALSASTTLVSITIGGNDAGFSSVMEQCVLLTTSSCLSAVSAAESFITGTLPGRLNNTLTALRAHAPNAKVVVLDYPELYDLSRSSGCIGLSTSDRTALNQGADKLDQVIANAAAANGDTFADVRPRFAGHEICDSGSWLNSVNVFNIGSSYHPTANGQELGYLPAFTAAA